MNYFSKTRVLVSIIVVLTVILIATAGTLLYGYYKHQQVEKQLNQNPREQMERQTQFLREKLNLSPEQEDIFRRSRNDFHSKTFEINRQIEAIDLELFNELLQPKINAIKIDSLVNQFGELQKSQKRLMMEHLMQIKNSCTPEQFNMFHKMLKHSHQHQMRWQRQHFQNKRMLRGNATPPQYQ